MKKYELILDDSIEVLDCKLFRIRALTSFGSVIKAGDLGGYIQKEDNLSHHDDAWVYGNAKVSGSAKVSGGAQVYGNAQIYGDAEVYGIARVSGSAKVSDNARVSDFAIVSGNAKVYNSAYVSGNAQVSGDAQIAGDALVMNTSDYIVYKNNWLSGRYFTWTESNDMWTEEWFYGTGDELIKKAYADSEDSGKHYEACVKSVETLKNVEQEK